MADDQASDVFVGNEIIFQPLNGSTVQLMKNRISVEWHRDKSATNMVGRLQLQNVN